MKNKKILKYILIGLGIVLAIGLLYVFLVYLPGQNSAKEAKSIITEANDLYDSREYFDAVDRYEESLDIDEGGGDSYLGLSRIYLLKNRKDKAIEILQLGISKARNTSKLNQLLGEIYLGDGDYSKAIYFLKKAVSSDKSNHGAKLSLALSYIGGGDLERAQSSLDFTSDDKNLNARAKILLAMLVGDDPDEASDLLDDIDMGNIDDDLANQVGFLEEVLSDIDDLDEDIKSDVYVDVMISRAALNSNYPDLVIGLLSTYVEDFELYYELNLYLGHAYLMKSDYEKSLEYLSQAYILESDSSVCARLIGRTYLGLNDDSEMIKYYERSINLSDGDEKISIRLEYFGVLIDKEQYARAEEQLERLLVDDDMDIDALLIIWCESLLNRQQYSQLEDNLSQIKFNNLTEENKSQYYYIEAGLALGEVRLDDAVESIEKAIEIDDTVAKYYLLYGKILYESGDDIHATEQLEKSVELDVDGFVSEEAEKILDR